MVFRFLECSAFILLISEKPFYLLSQNGSIANMLLADISELLKVPHECFFLVFIMLQAVSTVERFWQVKTWTFCFGLQPAMSTEELF